MTFFCIVATLRYTLPWQEVVTDLNDKIKSLSAGYASLNYTDAGFREARLNKIDILINKEPVDALSFICEKDSLRERGKEVVDRLKENIDRQQFEIVIQVSVAVAVASGDFTYSSIPLLPSCKTFSLFTI